MIEINLLPKELQKKKGPNLSGIPILPLGAAVVIVLFVLSFSLVTIRRHYQARFKRLTKQLQDKIPSKNEAVKLQAEVKRLESKKKVIDQLAKRKFFWAEKLNLISDLIPMGAWLSDLSFEEAKEGGVLTLDGMAVPYKDQEMINLVTLFMENLKQNEDFYNDFKTIELGPIRRIKSENVDAMQFSVICQFKEK